MEAGPDASSDADMDVGTDAGPDAGPDTGVDLGGPTCGDEVLDDGEQCEGNNLVGFDCVALGYAGGTLRCTDCEFDTDLCYL